MRGGTVSSKVPHEMSRSFFLYLIGVALAGAMPTSTSSFGRDWNAAAMLYSHGVHAYFAGDDTEAEQDLTQAIASNPTDPRPYYFRAMSRLHQGRDADARQDMQAGAAVEAAHRTAGASARRSSASRAETDSCWRSIGVPLGRTRPPVGSSAIAPATNRSSCASWTCCATPSRYPLTNWISRRA